MFYLLKGDCIYIYIYIGELLQTLLRGILGVKTMAHIPSTSALVMGFIVFFVYGV